MRSGISISAMGIGINVCRSPTESVAYESGLLGQDGSVLAGQDGSILVGENP